MKKPKLDSSLPSETDLIHKLSQGDEQSFTKLYDHYYDRVNHFVFKFVKSPQLSEDITQEVFIKIWEGRSSIHEKESFKAWLFVVARNHTLNMLKKISNESAGVGEILKNYQYQHSPIEEGMLENEYFQKVRDVLNSLPFRTREIFKLCREEGKSYDEVSEILGISRNAVKKHIVRSHKVFKENFKDKFQMVMGLFIV